MAPALPAAHPGPTLGARLHTPALWLIAGGTALRLILAAVLPLGNDEAYYVDWARHLQPGYLDHPPAVAWLVALALRALGPTTLAVRLPMVLLQAGTLWLAASLCRARGGERAGWVAVLALQAAPVFAVGAGLATPDAPLAFAWAGALWSVERALRRDARWAVLAGAFLGLGALSKLTAGLLALAVLAGLLLTRQGRALLRQPWPWLGVLAAAAVAAPMLLWNAAHGWPSFAFQASHGLRGRAFSIGRLAGSVGAQLGYVSPALLLLAAAASYRALRRRRDAFLAVLGASGLLVAAFFTAAAALTPGALPHWPAPGWFSAVLALCLAAPAGASWRRALWIGYAETAVAMAGVLLLLAIPFPSSISALGRTFAFPRGPVDDLLGWREGAAAARAVAGEERLAAGHWIVLGQLGWADGRSPAYLGERLSGPSFYDPDPGAAGRPLLVVTVDGLAPQVDLLEARLGPLRPAGSAEARQGQRVIRTFRFWWWDPLNRRR